VNSDQRKRWAILILMGLTVSGILAGLMTAPRFQALAPPLANTAIAADYGLQDQLVGFLPTIEPLDNVVFLGIDAKSLTIFEEDIEVIEKSPALTLMCEPWPWPREVWAMVVERLLDAGARLVMVDLLFNDEREGDAALQALAEAHPDQIVLAGSFSVPGSFQDDAEHNLAKFTEPAPSVVPLGSPAADAVGYVNFFPDFDGKIRRVTYRTTVEEISNQRDHAASIERLALSSRALERLGYEDRIPARPATRQMRFVSDLASTYPVLPIYEIFWPSLWERHYDSGQFFRDKIVMIGPSVSEFQDVHPTPVGNMLGAHLHLNALTAAIHDGLYQRAGSNLNALLIAAMALAAVLLVGWIRRPGTALLALLGAFLLFLFGAWLTFEQTSVLVSFFGPLAALTLTGAGGLAFDYSCIYRERLLLRQALERRVSKEVMQEILENPSGYLNQLGGVRKIVTVLFSDLRGFTTLSEKSDPDTLVSQLNQYFDIMVGVIQGDRGMVDKFIGDAIMAVWGSVPDLNRGEGSELAVGAALEMSRELPKLNTRWKREGLPELAMGLGVHCGDAVTGNVGSEKRLELTVIGDAVNLASRLEGVTKMYGVEIVISEVVADDLGEGWIVRPLDKVAVKGRKASVGIFEPLARPGDPEEARAAATRKASAFRDAFALYQDRQFTEAADAFDQFLENFPADQPTEKLARRCREFLETPPAEPWDGGVPLDSK